MANDIQIIAVISGIFIFLGVLLPFIQADFNTLETGHDPASLTDDINTDDLDSVSPFKVFFSVVSMFFWTFGALPFWLDMVFVVLRLVLILAIARNIWIGGGG